MNRKDRTIGRHGSRTIDRPLRSSVVCLACLLVALLPASGAGAESCVELVDEAKQEKDPVIVNKILQRALVVCQEQEDDNLRLYEQALRRKADNHLKLAKVDVSECDRYNDADRAVEGWEDYIEWFADDLTQEQQALFKPKKSIFRAINGLGEAIVFRGDGRTCGEIEGREQLFQTYREYDPEFFNEAAIELWRDQLWLCPDWPERRDKGLRRALEDRVCALEEDHCQDRWREYLRFLDLWTEQVERSRFGRFTSAIGLDSVKNTHKRLSEVFEQCESGE